VFVVAGYSSFTDSPGREEEPCRSEISDCDLVPGEDERDCDSWNIGVNAFVG